MSIVNGYISLSDFKLYAEITSTDANDDAALEDMIEAASRFIDRFTGRIFYAETATKLFDLPEGDTLYLETEDLLTVTTLTNGDGTTIASSNYWLLPHNTSPKYAIRLRASSGVSWDSATNGDVYACISIAGTWGYASSAPDNVKLACAMIANAYRQQRSGQGVQAATVTPGGLVLQDVEIPRPALAILRDYRRVSG